MTTTPKPAKTPKLKPCPFCGNDDPDEFDVTVFVFRDRVRCLKCLTIGPAANSVPWAYRRWNRRAPLDPRPTGRED